MLTERKQIIDKMNLQIQGAEACIKRCRNQSKAEAKTCKVSAEAFKQLQSSINQLNSVKTELKAYRSRFNVIARFILYFADLYQTAKAKKEVREINAFLKNGKIESEKPVNPPVVQKDKPKYDFDPKQFRKELDKQFGKTPYDGIDEKVQQELNSGKITSEQLGSRIAELINKASDKESFNTDVKGKLIKFLSILHYSPELSQTGDFYILDRFVKDLFRTIRTAPDSKIPTILSLLKKRTMELKFKRSAWDELESLKKHDSLQDDTRKQIDAILAKKQEMQDKVSEFQLAIALKLAALEKGNLSPAEMKHADLMKSTLTEVNQWLKENFSDANIPPQT